MWGDDMGFKVSYSFIEELLRDYYQDKCSQENLEFKFSVDEVVGDAHGWFEGDTYQEMSVTLIKRRNVNIALKSKSISFPVETVEIISNKEILDILRVMFDESLANENLKVWFFSLNHDGAYVNLERTEEKKLVLSRKND